MTNKYTKTVWVDDVTPINAEHLNNIENGIDSLYTNALSASDLLSDERDIDVEIDENGKVHFTTNTDYVKSLVGEVSQEGPGINITKNTEENTETFSADMDYIRKNIGNLEIFSEKGITIDESSVNNTRKFELSLDTNYINKNIDHPTKICKAGEGINIVVNDTEKTLTFSADVTKDYVTNSIAAAQLEGKDVDLSKYATISYVSSNTASINHKHNVEELVGISGYLKKSEMSDSYITKNEIEATYQPKGNYITEHQSLEDYAKKSDIDNFLDKTEASNTYLTKDNAEKTYLTTNEIEKKDDAVVTELKKFMEENYQPLTTLSNVAISGSYNDLIDKPEFSDVALSGSYNDLSDKPSYSNVAKTGSYNDLFHKPTFSSNNGINVIVEDDNSVIMTLDKDYITNLVKEIIKDI